MIHNCLGGGGVGDVIRNCLGVCVCVGDVIRNCLGCVCVLVM